MHSPASTSVQDGRGVHGFQSTSTTSYSRRTGRELTFRDIVKDAVAVFTWLRGALRARKPDGVQSGARCSLRRASRSQARLQRTCFSSRANVAFAFATSACSGGSACARMAT